MLKWKLIFWLAALTLTASAILIPFQEEVEALDVAFTVLTLTSLIPMYGYAYKVVIGTKPIAVLIFLANLAFGVYSLSTLAWLIATDGDAIFIYTTIISAPIFAIFTVPQYLYAFKSKELWSVAT